MSGAGGGVRTAVFLAAGRGRRLRPYTDKTPKPLLPVDGRPTLDYALTAAARAGISRVLLVTHYLEEQIKKYVGDGSAWGLQAAFAHQEGMLGTGHALQTAVSAHPTWFDSPFLLSATDYIFPLSFFAALQARYVGTGADIVVSMKAVPPEELSGRSSVRFAGDLVVEEVVEKPAPGTAPSPYAANLIYILPAAIAAGLKEIEPSARGEYEIQTAVNVLIRRGMRARGLLQIPLPEWTPPAD